MSEQRADHHVLPGINETQADEVVRRAYEVNAFRELVDHPDQTVAETARKTIAEHDDVIGFLAAPTEVEVVPVQPDQDSPDNRPRRKQTMVVDPLSGRIVPYGQMRRGDHPRGGQIVRR